MRVLLTILVVLCMLLCRAQGHASSYYLKGKIISKSGQAVKNTQCILQQGHFLRDFVTDNKGGFYVEVFFGVGYSCRRDTNGKPLADEYALSKDANADTIIISCGKGVGYLKSNWEKYYFEEKSNCNKGHVALWSYKGLNLTETANIELNPDIELPGKTFEIVTENRKKLEELSKTSNTDSLSIASNTKYFASHRYQLPDGREYQFPVDSNDVVELEDEDGTLRKIYGRGPHPFQKQMNTLFDLTASLWQIFEKIELRNRSISFIFSNEFLGDCRNIVKLQKVNEYLYHLPENPFKKKSPYFAIIVDNNDIITDVFYYETDTQ